MRGARLRVVVAVAGAAAIAAGCGLLDGDPFAFFRPSRLKTTAVPAVADDDDHLAWAASEPFFVVVRKSCRSLDVYRFGDRVRSFHAVFGLNSRGSKLYEGDLRTPIGLYSIVDKRRHPRWRHFLLLDYPNLQDLHRYWNAMEAGTLPQAGDGYARVGGAVGIHGTENPGLNARNVDWTFGCISLDNADIDDLAALVPVGTLVWIDD